MAAKQPLNVPSAEVDLEECNTWDPPSGAAGSEEGDSPPIEQDDRASLCVAVWTTLLSIPALVGSWCWPLLLAGLLPALKGINTTGARSFTHAVTWGFNLMVFSNVLQFVFVKTKKSRTGMAFMRKWGPFFCLLAALFLCMADLTRHLVNDAWGRACTEFDRNANPNSVLGISTGGTFKQLPEKYDTYCYSQNVGNEFLPNPDIHSTAEGPLSVYGWVFTIFCTWSGFVFFMVGIFWALQLPQKIIGRWNAVRSGRARAHARARAAAVAAA